MACDHPRDGLTSAAGLRRRPRVDRALARLVAAIALVVSQIAGEVPCSRRRAQGNASALRPAQLVLRASVAELVPCSDQGRNCTRMRSILPDEECPGFTNFNTNRPVWPRIDAWTRGLRRSSRRAARLRMPASLLACGGALRGGPARAPCAIAGRFGNRVRTRMPRTRARAPLSRAVPGQRPGSSR